MNFDISDRQIKLSMRGSDQLVVFQKDGHKFFPAFGINSNGTFMNLHIVDPNEAGKYRRGKNCVHIIRIFDDILNGQISPDALSDFLQGKTIVNVPNISVHSMVAGRDRCAYVVEPGRNSIPFDRASRDFLVLTNFPLSDYVDQDYHEVTGDGADRYKKCYKMLLESKNTFNADQGFAILEETSQSAGIFPTQFSMLAIPEGSIVYFAIKGEFSKRYTFSFADNTVRAGAGFEHQNHRKIDNKGVLLSELGEW
jgi:hypothetical protein